MPVGVQGIGWNGVGVGDALGGTVTRAKGRDGCALAEAGMLQPASIKLAMTNRCIVRIMD